MTADAAPSAAPERDNSESDGTNGSLPAAAAWPRISVLLIIVLVIFTGGAYLLWWFHSRARRINALVPSHPVPASSLVILYTLAIAYVGWGLSGHYVMGDTVTFALTVKVASYFSYGWNGLVCVQMASRLNRIYTWDEPDGRPFSRARAGFLQFLYVQWKLNRAERLTLRAPPVEVSQPAPDAPIEAPDR